MPLRKNIVITGASSGLGEGMARQFAARGRNLALAARRVDRLDALAGELRAAHGVTVVTRRLDVNDHAQVFAVFKEFRAELGALDRVIVNAGINRGQPIGTGRFAVNRQTMETNLVAALAQTEAAVEIFREQRAGHLVVVSSLSAVRGMPGILTVYAASKSGLAALTDGIRYDLHGSPIKVTLLLPGYIESEINEEHGNEPPYQTKAEAGAKALFRAIESETAKAYVPAFPWAPMSVALRVLPGGRLKKLV
ncbi:MAG TPA: SDR family oxidoreductase [Actinoallomurus sp.]|jgi:short-subunit dehydrogenase